MEFYVRKEGRNLGPLMPFQLREMLEEGRVAPTDLGWHDGMEKWAPLAEIEALSSFLPQPEAPDAPAAPPPGMPPLPPPLPAAPEFTAEQLARIQEVRRRSLLAWRRFFARALDLALFGVAALAAVTAPGWLDPMEFNQPQLWIVLAIAFLWMPLEALLLWRFGTTLGKVLLGLRVSDAAGGPLTLQQSFRRSMDVWLFGCGCEFPVLNVLPKMLSFHRFRFLGATSWDQRNETQVVANPAPAAGVVAAVLLFLAVLMIRMWMFMNHPPSEFEKLMEQLRRNPFSLPGENREPSPPPPPPPAGEKQNPPASAESAPAQE